MRTKILFPLILLSLLAVFPGHSWLGDSLKSNIEKNGIDSGVKITFSEFESSFPLEFKASKIAFSPLEVPFPISAECQNPNGVMSLASAFLLKRNIDIKASCYSGQIKSSLSGSLFSNQNNFDFKVNSLNFGEHSLTKLFGVSGKLSASGEGSSDERGERIDELTGEVSLSEVNYPGGFSYRGLFTVPEIANFNASCEVKIEGSEHDLRNCKGDSSLGSFKGRANAAISKNGVLVSGTSNFEIELKAPGMKTIAPYLALASGKYSENPASRWKFSSEKLANGREWSKITPLN